MRRSRHGLALFCRSVRFIAIVLGVLAPAGPAIAAPSAPPRSVAEYRDHLQALAALVAQCQQYTDAVHCNADAVGADERVTVPGETNTRQVSYAWLRRVFEHVGDGKHPLKPGEAAPLLDAAAERIRLEQSQAPGGAVNPTLIGADRATQSALSSILARAEFRRSERSLTQRVLQAIELWINHRLSGLAEYSSHRRWLGRVLVWGLLGFACAGLAVWFVRQTRRARGMHVGDAAAIEMTATLRSWERWRQEAEEAAAQQRWREAVRAFYWATIARLESRGQWPADRARTPREYLRLLLPDHPKHHDLRLLTRRFEACWYGASSATQPDCEAARQLFDRLVAR